MNQKKSKRWTLPKALLIIPVAALAIGVFANNAAVNNTTTETDIDAITTATETYGTTVDKPKATKKKKQKTSKQKKLKKQKKPSTTMEHVVVKDSVMGVLRVEACPTVKPVVASIEGSDICNLSEP